MVRNGYLVHPRHRCRVLVTADFSWVESPTFQSTVGVVIILNAVIMGLETDSESAFFEWTEQFMLAFFVLEAVLRIRHRGWDFFMSPEDTAEIAMRKWGEKRAHCDLELADAVRQCLLRSGACEEEAGGGGGRRREDRGWNLVDFTIVASGVVDDWILKAWSLITQQQQQGDNLSKLMTLARLLRLMRTFFLILRLVRVVRAIRPLYMLAIGVVRAMQSMFWVLVLTFVALYAIAIVTTRAIGRGELLSIDADIPEAFRSPRRFIFSSKKNTPLDKKTQRFGSKFDRKISPKKTIQYFEGHLKRLKFDTDTPA
eukprot:s1850_g6.t1